MNWSYRSILTQAEIIYISSRPIVFYHLIEGLYICEISRDHKGDPVCQVNTYMCGYVLNSRGESELY